jgi:phosphate-selective porin OprO/OprP
MMANNAILDKRMTWAAGMFRDTGGASGTDFANSDKGYNFTARVTGLPYYANEGKQLVHLGAGYSYRTMSDTQKVLYGAAPEVDSKMVSKFIQTDATATGFKATRANVFGGEAATVWNSFHAESEFIASRVQAGDYGDPCYKGFYAQAGYFLTGEVRPYNRATGVFDRVKPLKNFRENDGLGAWEVAARYSYLDLGQQEIGPSHGELNDVTLGLNWYLNPMIRVMWNYIHSMPSTVKSDGSADILMMRFQIDF